MFRSTDEEFLLCYDGMIRMSLCIVNIADLLQKNLVFMSTNMVILLDQATPLNGKELQSVSHATSLTFSYSIHGSLRSGTFLLADSLKSFQELTFDAPGMDVEVFCARTLHHTM